MIRVQHFTPPPINEREILRYAGAKPDAEDVKALMRDCFALCEKKLRYDVCFATFPLRVEEERLDLGFAQVESHSLARNLQGCSQVILFAATIGLEMDRLLARNRLFPARHLMLQAIGAERVESLCDCFEEELKDQWIIRPRFSPGYGDVPLTLQRNVFRALDDCRQIGIFLNESLLMTPSKSVTAIIGVCGERSQA